LVSLAPSAISVVVTGMPYSAAHERALPVLHILGDVDDDGSGTPGSSQFERAADGRLEPFGIGNQEDVFGNRAHDRRHRRFLEGIRADGARRHLAADDHDRDRVRHAVAHRRHGVRRPRPGRHHDDADLATRTRIAGGHESCALLVGGDDERHRRAAVLAGVQLVVAKDRVVGRQDRAAAVTEDRVDALISEHLHHDVGAAHDFSFQGMTARALCAGLFAHRTAVAL
jgi:hypothetical protein